MGIPAIPEGPGPLTDAVEGNIYVWCIVTAPITILATALRFYATKRSGRNINLEDWFALVALLTHIAFCITMAWAIAFINGNPIQSLTLPQMTYVGKVTYSAIPYFPVNQFFAKFSILLLYHRLFSVNKAFVRWVYFLGCLQIIYSVATLFVSIFGCSPISGSWDPVVSMTAKCVNHNQYLAGSETVNSFVDFAMVGLAIWMIQDLRMKNSLKWKLSIPFILGGASGVIGFVKIGETYHSTNPLKLEAGLWTAIQQAASCICCCVPIYGILLPKGDWVRRYFSYFSISSWSSRSRTLRNSEGSRGSSHKKWHESSSSEEKISGSHNSGSPTRGSEWSQNNTRSQAWAETPPAISQEVERGLTSPNVIHVQNTVDMV